MSRIQPVSPPYDESTAQRLAAMMPPGVEPILLFRTFAKNLSMAAAMGPWGSYELSRKLSLSMRDREVLIDRTCARCHCEYEWGVHVAFFADRVELSRDQIASITHGDANDSCWTNERDRLLIRAADALHDDATISDDLHDHHSKRAPCHVAHIDQAYRGSPALQRESADGRRTDSQDVHGGTCGGLPSTCWIGRVEGPFAG